MSYYSDKITALKSIFGADDIVVTDDSVTVVGHRYPVVDDVIILLEARYWPESLRQRLAIGADACYDRPFSEIVQYSFGEQWKTFSAIMPEHEKEFRQYFDLIDLSMLEDKRCVDIGCGIGRWSYFLAPYCREIVLLDFSEAIFVARQNLRKQDNAIFFMGDLTAMPFRDDFGDLLFSLGVLHHLPLDCLDLTRSLSRYAPQLLIYIYYALDNRPVYFRVFLWVMNVTRRGLCKIRHLPTRNLISYGLVFLAYMPFVLVGRLAALVGCGHKVPLYEFYKDKSLRRIQQDAYDRFFTALEQRATRRQIMSLEDTFSQITVSKGMPYWHFLCKR